MDNRFYSKSNLLNIKNTPRKQRNIILLSFKSIGPFYQKQDVFKGQILNTKYKDIYNM